MVSPRLSSVASDSAGKAGPTLLHVVGTHSVAPQHVFHKFLDEAGDSWKTTIPSQNMVIYTTSKAITLKPFTDTETP